MDNNILKLKNNNGEDIEIEVLDIITNDEIKRDYIIYRIKDQEDVLVSILNQKESSYSLDTIEDVNEFNELEAYLTSQASKIETSGDKTI